MSEQKDYDQLIEQKDFDKKNVAEKAMKYIKDGMTIGLGSGSTVYWLLKELSKRTRQGMKVRGIPSSKRTEGWAKEFGIQLTNFSDVQQLDIAIDGADEIDENFNLLKGGGGSLVREKIVNQTSDRFIVIADQSKLVKNLGVRSLPVEVLPFGWQVTAINIKRLGGSPKLRYRKKEVFISDNGNYILDCYFGAILYPNKLHEQLKKLTGVVETGLFPNMADKIIVGAKGEVSETNINQ